MLAGLKPLLTSIMLPQGVVKSELEESRSLNLVAWIKSLHEKGKSLDPTVPGGEKSFAQCVDTIIKEGTAWLAKEGKDASQPTMKYMQSMVTATKALKTGLAKMTAQERADVNQLAKDVDTIELYEESIEQSKKHGEALLKHSTVYAQSQMAEISQLQRNMEGARRAWAAEAKMHGGVLPTAAMDTFKRIKEMCEAAQNRLVAEYRKLTGLDFWQKAFGPIPRATTEQGNGLLFGCKQKLEELKKTRDAFEDLHAAFPDAVEDAGMVIKSLK